MKKPKASKRWDYIADDPEHFYENQGGAPQGFVETLPVDEEEPPKKRRRPKRDVVKLGFGSEMRNWRTKAGPRTFKRPVDR